MCLERAKYLCPLTWMLGKSEDSSALNSYESVMVKKCIFRSHVFVSFEGFQLGVNVLVQCYTVTPTQSTTFLSD